eukprot:COSAG02_NODE_662_length_18752_cov_10.146464_7_plen_62_part_00
MIYPISKLSINIIRSRYYYLTQTAKDILVCVDALPSLDDSMTAERRAWKLPRPLDAFLLSF